MKEIVSDTSMVAYCGLYCGACKRYLSDKCGGCNDNIKAMWCKIRSCCINNKYASCADCRDFQDPRDCRMFNNIISKVFGFIFRSDRAACIDQIKELGIKGHADKMTGLRRHSLQR